MKEQFNFRIDADILTHMKSEAESQGISPSGYAVKAIAYCLQQSIILNVPSTSPPLDILGSVNEILREFRSEMATEMATRIEAGLAGIEARLEARFVVGNQVPQDSEAVVMDSNSEAVVMDSNSEAVVMDSNSEAVVMDPHSEAVVLDSLLDRYKESVITESQLLEILDNKGKTSDEELQEKLKAKQIKVPGKKNTPNVISRVMFKNLRVHGTIFEPQKK